MNRCREEEHKLSDFLSLRYEIIKILKMIYVKCINWKGKFLEGSKKLMIFDKNRENNYYKLLIGDSLHKNFKHESVFKNIFDD